MAAPQLKFHGSPWRMTAATLPALLLLLCFYSAEEYLGSVVCFLLSVAFVALALHAGIAPAYFPHVDHPLHVLDRLRWGCGCVALLILFVASRCSNGCVFSYVSLRSQAVLSVQDYSEAGVADAGLVQINGLMDSSRIGAVASCSSCTTSECARKDCRREAALNNISDLPQMEGLHKLNFLENQILFRRLSGAGGGGGGGGGGGHGGKGNTCSITCLYVAPLLPAAYAKDYSMHTGRPVAWAVQSGSAPSPEQKLEVIGTSHFDWWSGSRQGYQRAMDDLLRNQLPAGLRHCDGLQAVPDSKSWWTGCSHNGFIDCPRELKGECCCPLGHRIVEDRCEPCGDFADSVEELHALPLLYTLSPETGKSSFHVMLLLAFLTLPLPWAFQAQLRWRLGWKRAEEAFLHYAVRHQRKEAAESWGKLGRRRSSQGPITVEVSSISGETRKASGFHGSSLLLHLRKEASAIFQMDFVNVGLVVGSRVLPTDLDFKTLDELGIGNGTFLSVVFMPPEEPSWRDRLAGTSESHAYTFFRRNRNVYRARDCQHLAQLRLAQGNTINFGQSYTKGWTCDGCEKFFAPGTMLRRCDICRIDFCERCAASAGFPSIPDEDL